MRRAKSLFNAFYSKEALFSEYNFILFELSLKGRQFEWDTDY